MVSWKIVYTKEAVKDAKKLTQAGLQKKAKQLLALIEEDPFSTALPYEKLVGDLNGAYSRRINIKHRLVYQVLKQQKTIKVLRMWTHYE
jgi:Txe/YoeB family toxin of toxin-antitoxin system